MYFLLLAPIVLAALVLLMRRVNRSAERTSDWVPAARWERTDEVITDPFTHQVIRVWVDPQTGDRHYVPERFPGRGGPG